MFAECRLTWLKKGVEKLGIGYDILCEVLYQLLLSCQRGSSMAPQPY
jgi:hypothetical protein